jgi:hypothetical protein
LFQANTHLQGMTPVISGIGGLAQEQSFAIPEIEKALVHAVL